MAHSRACRFDHAAIETQSPGDVQAGGFSGRAQTQNISRLERSFIEAHRAIENTFGARAVDLHGLQMGGSKRKRAASSETFQNHNSQRSALFGVRRAA